MPPEENSPKAMAMILKDGGQEEGIAMPLETSDNEQGLTGEPMVQIARPVPKPENLETIRGLIAN